MHFAQTSACLKMPPCSRGLKAYKNIAFLSRPGSKCRKIRVPPPTLCSKCGKIRVPPFLACGKCRKIRAPPLLACGKCRKIRALPHASPAFKVLVTVQIAMCSADLENQQKHRFLLPGGGLPVFVTSLLLLSLVVLSSMLGYISSCEISWPQTKMK